MLDMKLKTYSMLNRQNHIKKNTSLVLRYALLVILAAFFMFPVIYLLITACLSDTAASTPQGLFPDFKEFNFQGFAKVLTYGDSTGDLLFARGLVNTLIVCALSILGILLAASFCAYGLTKVYFKGQKILFGLILATVFLPGTVTSIPLFTIYSKIGWCNTLYPLWVPIWLGGGAMNIFLIRQFMKGIPKSLNEAALIDGASSFRILVEIIAPLIKPILIYLAVTTFMGCWNDYSTPLMYLTKDSSPKTLALMLFETFDKDKSFKLNAQMATGVLMMIPTTILFALFQKELTEGVATIGIKG